MPQSNSFAAHLDTSNVAICAGTSIQYLGRGAGQLTYVRVSITGHLFLVTFYQICVDAGDAAAVKRLMPSSTCMQEVVDPLGLPGAAAAAVFSVLVVVVGLSLRQLILMVRERQICPASVDVHRLA